MPASLVEGTLKMDAAYVISAGGGNVITAGGGNVISAGGGNVISAGGGNVISAGGGNVITAGGGNVISAGGGNVITAGAGNYRLVDFASPAAPEEVPIGTILPAAGMVVVPVSLATNVQIGDAVLTDSQGHYQVRVPKSFQGAFRLVAAVPGKSADDPWLQDPRLQYALLSSASRSAADNAVDEDTSAMTSYMTLSLTVRFSEMLAQGLTSNALGQVSGPLADLAKDVVQAMADADTMHMAPEKRDRLARKCVGIWLANGQDAYFTALASTSAKDLANAAPTEAELATLAGNRKALDVLVGAMRDMRDRATRVARAHPNDYQSYINARPYVQRVLAMRNQEGDPLKGFVIKRPADLLTFALYAYNSRGDGTFGKMEELTSDPDMAYDDPRLPLVQFTSGGFGVANMLFLKLFVEPTKSELVKTIREAATTP